MGALTALEAVIIALLLVEGVAVVSTLQSHGPVVPNEPVRQDLKKQIDDALFGLQQIPDAAYGNKLSKVAIEALAGNCTSFKDWMGKFVPSGTGSSLTIGGNGFVQNLCADLPSPRESASSSILYNLVLDGLLEIPTWDVPDGAHMGLEEMVIPMHNGQLVRPGIPIEVRVLANEGTETAPTYVNYTTATMLYPGQPQVSMYLATLAAPTAPLWWISSADPGALLLVVNETAGVALSNQTLLNIWIPGNYTTVDAYSSDASNTANWTYPTTATPTTPFGLKQIRATLKNPLQSGQVTYKFKVRVPDSGAICTSTTPVPVPPGCDANATAASALWADGLHNIYATLDDHGERVGMSFFPERGAITTKTLAGNFVRGPYVNGPLGIANAAKAKALWAVTFAAPSTVGSPAGDIRIVNISIRQPDGLAVFDNVSGANWTLVDNSTLFWQRPDWCTFMPAPPVCVTWASGGPTSKNGTLVAGDNATAFELNVTALALATAKPNRNWPTIAAGAGSMETAYSSLPGIYRDRLRAKIAETTGVNNPTGYYLTPATVPGLLSNKATASWAYGYDDLEGVSTYGWDPAVASSGTMVQQGVQASNLTITSSSATCSELAFGAPPSRSSCSFGGNGLTVQPGDRVYLNASWSVTLPGLQSAFYVLKPWGSGLTVWDQWPQISGSPKVYNATDIADKFNGTVLNPVWNFTIPGDAAYGTYTVIAERNLTLSGVNVEDVHMVRYFHVGPKPEPATTTPLAEPTTHVFSISVQVWPKDWT